MSYVTLNQPQETLFVVYMHSTEDQNILGTLNRTAITFTYMHL